MLKLTPSPTFTASVQISVPGSEIPETIKVVFRYKSADQLSSWFESSKESKTRDALSQVIDSWSGVFDADGEAVPYSLDALDALITAYSPSGRELIRAYVRELTESRSKN